MSSSKKICNICNIKKKHDQFYANRLQCKDCYNLKKKGKTYTSEPEITTSNNDKDDSNYDSIKLNIDKITDQLVFY